jgi:replicative DNA helicase
MFQYIKENLRSDIAILTLIKSNSISISKNLEYYLKSDKLKLLLSLGELNTSSIDNFFFNNDIVDISNNQDAIKEAKSIWNNLTYQEYMKNNFDDVFQKTSEAICGKSKSKRMSLRELGELYKEADMTLHPIGFPSLDNALNGGIAKNSLNLLVAATNVGKTAIMVNLAIKSAEMKKKTLFLSLEQDAKAVMSRFIQNHLKVNRNKAQEAFIMGGDESFYKKYEEYLDIEYISSNTITVDEFVKTIDGYDVVVVDYYKHFQPTKENNIDSNYEQEHIVQTLRIAATDKDITIWSGVQMNVSYHNDKRNKKEPFTPSNAHIAGSQQAPMQAETVIFVYRKDKNDSEPISASQTLDPDYTEFDVYIRKNRSGNVDMETPILFKFHTNYQTLIDPLLVNTIPTKIEIIKQKRALVLGDEA